MSCFPLPSLIELRSQVSPSSNGARLLAQVLTADRALRQESAQISSHSVRHKLLTIQKMRGDARIRFVFSFDLRRPFGLLNQFRWINSKSMLSVPVSKRGASAGRWGDGNGGRDGNGANTQVRQRSNLRYNSPSLSRWADPAPRRTAFSPGHKKRPLTDQWPFQSFVQLFRSSD